MQVFFSKKGKKQAEVCVTGVAAILQKPGGAERDRRGDRSARRRECVPSPPLAIDGVRAGDRIRNTRMPVQMPIGETGGRRLFVSAGWKYHGKIHGYLDKSARVLQKAAGGPAPQACRGGMGYFCDWQDTPSRPVPRHAVRHVRPHRVMRPVASRPWDSRCDSGILAGAPVCVAWGAAVGAGTVAAGRKGFCIAFSARPGRFSSVGCYLP